MMTRRTSLALLGLALLGPVQATPEIEPAARRTVVVELFTSQGCSSCPAADEVLSRIGAEGVRGVDVIPLSFHVDYWNYIGWTDPFSSEAWSHRQQRYAASFDSDRVYTPQVVVDGQSECVGAYRGEVERLIRRATRRPTGGRIEVALDDGGAGSRLGIIASVDGNVDGATDLLAALFETGLTTEVGRGENARRTLRNDYVVRRLIPLARLEPGESWAGDREIEIDEDWRRENLGVAVLLQSPETFEIRAATAARFE